MCPNLKEYFVIRNFAISGLFALSALASTLAHADADHAGDIAVSAVAGKLTTGGDHFEIHGGNGYKIFEADFGDFTSGPYVTKNPGFQTQGSATLAPLSLLSFSAIGSLNYWNGSAWGAAPTGVSVSFKDVLDELTTWTASGSTAGATSYVDQVATDGSLHSHLTMSVTPGAAAGAYMVQLRLDSDTYASSDPFYVVFNRGLSGESFESSVESLAAPVPEPSTYALMLAGLVGVTALARRRKQG